MGLLLKETDISTTCVAVIFKVKVNCTISVDGIKLWSFKILLVIFQLSHDVIGYKVTRQKGDWRITRGQYYHYDSSKCTQLFTLSLHRDCKCILPFNEE